MHGQFFNSGNHIHIHHISICTKTRWLFGGFAAGNDTHIQYSAWSIFLVNSSPPGNHIYTFIIFLSVKKWNGSSGILGLVMIHTIGMVICLQKQHGSFANPSLISRQSAYNLHEVIPAKTIWPFCKDITHLQEIIHLIILLIIQKPWLKQQCPLLLQGEFIFFPQNVYKTNEFYYFFK